MCAVAVQDSNLRAQRNLFAKHLDRWLLFDDASAERVFCLKPYYKDCISRIAGTVREVMKNPSGFRHSRSGDDDHRTVHAVQRLGFLHVSRVAQKVEAKQLMHLLDEILAGVESLRVQLEDGGYV